MVILQKVDEPHVFALLLGLPNPPRICRDSRALNMDESIATNMNMATNKSFSTPRFPLPSTIASGLVSDSEGFCANGDFDHAPGQLATSACVCRVAVKPTVVPVIMTNHWECLQRCIDCGVVVVVVEVSMSVYLRNLCWRLKDNPTETSKYLQWRSDKSRKGFINSGCGFSLVHDFPSAPQPGTLYYALPCSGKTHFASVWRDLGYVVLDTDDIVDHHSTVDAFNFIIDSLRVCTKQTIFCRDVIALIIEFLSVKNIKTLCYVNHAFGDVACGALVENACTNTPISRDPYKYLTSGFNHWLNRGNPLSLPYEWDPDDSVDWDGSMLRRWRRAGFARYDYHVHSSYSINCLCTWVASCAAVRYSGHGLDCFLALNGVNGEATNSDDVDRDPSVEIWVEHDDLQQSQLLAEADIDFSETVSDVSDDDIRVLNSISEYMRAPNEAFRSSVEAVIRGLELVARMFIRTGEQLFHYVGRTLRAGTDRARQVLVAIRGFVETCSVVAGAGLTNFVALWDRFVVLAAPRVTAALASLRHIMLRCHTALFGPAVVVNEINVTLDNVFTVFDVMRGEDTHSFWRNTQRSVYRALMRALPHNTRSRKIIIYARSVPVLLDLAGVVQSVLIATRSHCVGRVGIETLVAFMVDDYTHVRGYREIEVKTKRVEPIDSHQKATALYTTETEIVTRANPQGGADVITTKNTVTATAMPVLVSAVVEDTVLQWVGTRGVKHVDNYCEIRDNELVPYQRVVLEDGHYHTFARQQWPTGVWCMEGSEVYFTVQVTDFERAALNFGVHVHTNLDFAPRRVIVLGRSSEVDTMVTNTLELLYGAIDMRKQNLSIFSPTVSYRQLVANVRKFLQLPPKIVRVVAFDRGASEMAMVMDGDLPLHPIRNSDIALIRSQYMVGDSIHKHTAYTRLVAAFVASKCETPEQAAYQLITTWDLEKQIRQAQKVTAGFKHLNPRCLL